MCSVICRTSQNNICRICRGFFESPVHLAKQFSYVTEVGDLRDVVEMNFKKQLGEFK